MSTKETTEEAIHKIRTQHHMLLEFFEMNGITEDDAIQAMMYCSVVMIGSMPWNKKYVTKFLKIYNERFNDLILHGMGFKD